jgi:hypothetical protein
VGRCGRKAGPSGQRLRHGRGGGGAGCGEVGELELAERAHQWPAPARTRNPGRSRCTRARCRVFARAGRHGSRATARRGASRAPTRRGRHHGFHPGPLQLKCALGQTVPAPGRQRR